ncbi:MAG: right-handed parallel beta-helix repeat-containing protein [Deltaproteobacteria bacterium]|nr:right-handed parallel beta-helix repeat-containing protein [Deltaproteobacteria bacterium]
MTVKLTILMCLFFIIVSCMPVYAAIYYVAIEGKDSNLGTKIRPWQTIQKAADTLVAGDTVYIKGGTYLPNTSITAKNSGESGKDITYSAYLEDTVIIDGQNVSLPNWYGLFKVVNKEYVRIMGLKIINSKFAGIFVGNSKNIIIKGNYTSDTSSSGIGVWNSKNIIVDGNKIQRACWPTDGKQECLSVNGSHNVEIRNNHVYNGGDIGGEGIDVKNGSSNVKVYSNHVHNVYSAGIYIDAFKFHTHDIDVFRNVVHNCTGKGIVAASEQGGLLENVNIFNNVVYNNKSNGIIIGWALKPNNPLERISVFNNTCYRNGGYGIYIGATAAKDIVIRNNICSQNMKAQIRTYRSVPLYQVIIENNLINGPGSFMGDKSVSGDPKFIAPDNGDFHLQHNSPAIDNGTAISAPSDDFDGNVRPYAGAYDIGAYELGI